MGGHPARKATSREVESLKISTEIVKACADAKAKDISALCINKISDLFDFFIVATGKSDRQVQGICNNVVEALKKRGIDPISVEGLDQGHWVVVDYGDIVLHVFYEPIREHYDIESLWARAEPMELKKKGRGTTLALKAA